MTISEILREARINSGLTQTQLGKKLGYSTGQFLSNVEKGISGLPPKKYRQLAKLLGIPLRDLIAADLEDYEKNLRRKVG